MAWLFEKSQGRAVLDDDTGLPNGRALREGHASYEVEPTHVAYLDLDLFGAINRALGNEAGDAALSVVGNRCRNLPAADGVVYRAGGDEFAFVTFGTRESATQSLRRLMDAIRQPIPDIDGRYVTATAGLVEILAGEDLWSALERAHDR